MSERTCADEALQNEAAAWHEHYKQAEKTIADLLAQRDALQCELDTLRAVDEMNRPDMREIVGELRRINDMTGEYSMVGKALSALLRRIDRESEEAR